MPVNYIALAIPFFFTLIGIEYVISRLKRRSVYRFNDAVTDLGCGIGSQVVGLFMKGALAAGYLYLYDRFAFLELESKPVVAWLIAFFGVDLLYYWWHRTSHRVNVVWATHIVHHQSQDYNLAVALRQAWFSEPSIWVFYLPLAFLGVPPLIFLAAKSFSVLYQFWIHTELVGKLGPLEWVLNTPSHHRVHHAINPKYIDKNYAATLIVWDRLFGTFQKEEEPCVYGTVKPYTSWNPIWANFEHLGYLIRQSLAAPYFTDKIRIWFSNPAWRPRQEGTGAASYERPAAVDAKTFVKWNTSTGIKVTRYVALNFVIIVVMTTFLLFQEANLTPTSLLIGTAFILMTLLIWGGLFERKSWAVYLESVRLPAFIVLSYAWWAGLYP